MKILVTGATGLVGARLVPRLLAAGHECRVLVRAGKAAPEGVDRVEGDILDAASLAAAVDGIDAVVHLAALFRTTDTEQIWAVNRDGTRNLIDAVKATAPGARFVMASTCLVYSETGGRPAVETDAVAPTLAYPASKVEAENLLKESGLVWSILRFGFVYGDGDGHIAQLPRIIDVMQLHPANRFSMVHHRDIATFVDMALAGTFDGRIVNTTDEAPMSIFELCKLIGAPIQGDGASLNNPWFGVMDGSLAQALGFKAAVPTTWQAMREGVL